MEHKRNTLTDLDMGMHSYDTNVNTQKHTVAIFVLPVESIPGGGGDEQQRQHTRAGRLKQGRAMHRRKGALGR